MGCEPWLCSWLHQIVVQRRLKSTADKPSPKKMFIRWSHAAHPRPLGSPTMSFHGPSGWRRTISIALRWDFDYLPGGIGRRALPVGVRDVAGRDLTPSGSRAPARPRSPRTAWAWSGTRPRDGFTFPSLKAPAQDRAYVRALRALDRAQAIAHRRQHRAGGLPACSRRFIASSAGTCRSRSASRWMCTSMPQVLCRHVLRSRPDPRSSGSPQGSKRASYYRAETRDGRTPPCGAAAGWWCETRTRVARGRASPIENDLPICPLQNHTRTSAPPSAPRPSSSRPP